MVSGLSEADRPAFESMLRYLEGIHRLPAGGRERLLGLLRAESLAKGEYFLRSGESPVKVGFMTEGWLRYFRVGDDGREHVKYFCNGGNFVASQTALVKGVPSEFSIQAIEPSRLLVFDYRDWLQLSESQPAWAIMHRAILDRALESAERRERSLIAEDAAARYRRFLAEYPGAEDHVKQYDIASYLGLSPVSLSRIRGEKTPRS